MIGRAAGRCGRVLESRGVRLGRSAMRMGESGFGLHPATVGGAPVGFRAAAAAFPALPSVLVSCLSTRPAEDAVAEENAAREVAEEGEEADGSTTRTGTGVESEGGGSEAEEGGSEVEAELEKLREEVVALKDSRLRALAELENVRRIAERDVEVARLYSIQKFAKSLLDVSDNLQRALDSVPSDAQGEGGMLDMLVEGVEGTRVGLHKVFESYDIAEFGTVGEKFDPNKHEAVLQVPATDEVPAGHIAQVLKTGFTFKDRILRPAQVGTAK